MHNIHLLYNNIQLLTYVSVDMECYWTVNLIILTSALRRSIWRLLFNNTPCLPQHKSIIVIINLPYSVSSYLNFSFIHSTILDCLPAFQVINEKETFIINKFTGVIPISLFLLATGTVLRKAAIDRGVRLATGRYGCRYRGVTSWTLLEGS